MSEIKQKGLEAKLFEGVYTVEVSEPMIGITIGTENYTVDEINEIYVLPEGVTTIVSKDTDPEAFVESVYSAANHVNAKSMYDAVDDKALRSPESLLEKIESMYDDTTVTEDQIYGLLQEQDNLYRVPHTPPPPGLFSRIKEAVTPVDDVTRVLSYIIVGATMMTGVLGAYQCSGGPVQTAPVQTEPVQYESCDAAREAYSASKNVADRREIRAQIKTLCE